MTLRILRYASTVRARIFLADAHVFAVVDHRHPQAQDLGAALLDDVLRRDGVAERLRHLAARSSIDEAVREHLVERRAAARADADEQRAVEPAAMLVAALEVDVGRPVDGRRGTAAPPRGSSPSRTRRRGCWSRARTRCRRTAGTSSPSGTNSSSGRSYQASAPLVEDRGGLVDERLGQHAAGRTSSQSMAGIGTPQTRWREMHQSGRFAIMP